MLTTANKIRWSLKGSGNSKTLEKSHNQQGFFSNACPYLRGSFPFSASAYFISLGSSSSLAQFNPFYFSIVNFSQFWRSKRYPFSLSCYEHSPFQCTNLAFSFGLSFLCRFMVFRFHIRSPLVQAWIPSIYRSFVTFLRTRHNVALQKRTLESFCDKLRVEFTEIDVEIGFVSGKLSWDSFLGHPTKGNTKRNQS
jgi:hypothetical protein